MKVRGPLFTLAAVAAVGVGILTVNISTEESVVPGTPLAAPKTTSTTVAVPPAPAFPAKADYVGKIAAGSSTPQARRPGC